MSTASFRCLLCIVGAEVHPLIKCTKPLRSPKSLASLETPDLFLQLSAVQPALGVPEEASLSRSERWDRWVCFPQCGQSLKLKGPDSAQAAVFIVHSSKIAFFFYFRNI